MQHFLMRYCNCWNWILGFSILSAFTLLLHLLLFLHIIWISFYSYSSCSLCSLSVQFVHSFQVVQFKIETRTLPNNLWTRTFKNVQVIPTNKPASQPSSQPASHPANQKHGVQNEQFHCLLYACVLNNVKFMLSLLFSFWMFCLFWYEKNTNA